MTDQPDIVFEILEQMSDLAEDNDVGREALWQTTNIIWRDSSEARADGENETDLKDIVLAINELSLTVRSVGAVLARELRALRAPE